VSHRTNKRVPRARLETTRRAQLPDNLKRVEEWASKVGRANRLRALAAEFESKPFVAASGVLDADRCGLVGRGRADIPSFA